MQVFERHALVASVVVGLGLAGFMVVRGYKEPACPAMSQTMIVSIPVPVVVAPEPASESDAPVPNVLDAAPTCKAGSKELTEAVRSWLNDRWGGGMRIDLSRGIQFTHTTVDTGMEGPYPRHFGAEAKLACGSEAEWLRTQVKQTLANKYEVRCCNDECTYDGMEYAPIGTVRFAERDGSWILTGWNESYTVGLTEEYANEAARSTAKVIAKMPTKCNETPGVELD